MRERSEPRRRRGGRIVAAIVALLVIGWAVAAYLVIIDPTLNRPQHADAIVVLGGATVDDRLDRALELIEQGYASTLLISEPDADRRVIQVCATPIPHVTVTCFAPHPTTTQGEAREIGAQAVAHGWHTVLVVTSTYHISRARLIIDRCFRGRLVMLDARAPTLSEWAYNLFYQTGAYGKALVNTGC